MASSIIDRVRKLLALAADSAATPAEAALAASKAAELMETYRISRLDLESRGDAPEEPIGMEELISLARVCGWRGSLASSVGKATSCKVWWEFCYDANGKQEAVLVCAGRESDRIAALCLWSHLLAEVERLTALAVAESRSYRNTETWKRSFRCGAVSSIGEKLRQRTHGERTEATNALVRVADQKLSDFMDDVAPNLRKGRAYKVTDPLAWGNGHRAGKGVDVTRNDRRFRSSRALPAAS